MSLDKNALDRHITGNYGLDQYPDDGDDGLCEECHDRPALEGGTYAGICQDCAYQAHLEDKADRERDER